ncbi:FtsW/RodA/SpoVE family cell cycle protein [Anaerocolumna sp.]|uniref:FtsW/RodA/SpoVE family cell cycle protein n=1 Tax=Anaerocolumna sp. TaxID=2041569 RepID=UPI0028AD73CB|nr:FtsW/RodA/SpoVE family cell cycle protein [Anaerocolumna sp.]
MFNLKQYNFKNYNITLVVIVVLLSSIGAFLVSIAQQEGENIFKKQIFGIFLGFFIVFIVSIIDYHFISEFYILLYIVNLILLVLVKLVGVEINNSRRWLNLKVVTIQPSEFSKIIMIIFLAKMYTILREKMDKFYVLVLTGLLMGIPTYLILTQTNLSTSLVMLFIFVIMIFAAGLSYKIILPIILIGIPLFFGLFWYVQQDFQCILTPYQQKRVIAFLNPESEASTDTLYQQENSIQVIGAGKLTGKLLTEGMDSIEADTYVPISESDFIFSILGEAFGFIGACVIIFLLAILIFQCLKIAKNAPDRLGMLIAIGIASMFMFQVFVNLGVTTGLLPNTGLPLPFVSYGLSSLMSCMIAIGLVLNINLQRKRKGGNT